MAGLRPQRIAIDPDDYHARDVGRTIDGRQLILTTPFLPERTFHGGITREFIALYLFDADGQLLGAKIDALGPRKPVDREAASQLMRERLEELGEIERCRIEVAPFAVERFGTMFGLIVREPESEGEGWAVEMQPGNYMAFFEPWDSGVYDT